MIEYTPALASAFTSYMSQRFKCTVIRKNAAFEMQALGAAFDIAKRFGAQVPSGDDFLKRYATTIGGLVYMPDGWTPEQQIDVLTHECQHVHQFYVHGLGLPGGPGMWWLYLTEPEARVRYECEAIRSQMELRYHLTGNVGAHTLDQLVMPLEGGYALGQQHLALARDLLDIAATSVLSGVVSTEAGKAAIEWMKTRAVPGNSQ